MWNCFIFVSIFILINGQQEYQNYNNYQQQPQPYQNNENLPFEQRVAQGIDNNVNAAANSITNLRQSASNAYNNVAGWFDSAGNYISNTAHNAYQGAAGWVDNAGQTIGNAYQRTGQAIGNAAGYARQGVSNAAASAGNYVGEGLERIGQNIQSNPNPNYQNYGRRRK